MAEHIEFSSRIRHWRQDPPGGLAVIDIPPDLVDRLGGRRQWKVEGSVNDTAFSGSTMLVAGGGYCVGISKAAMKAAGVGVGEEVKVRLARTDG
jgi:hypothetical protein